jgi:peptide deformylase
MKRLDIFQFPAPLLREKSKVVAGIDGNLLDFISEMKFTLYANKHCVGIAAPQVGFLKRIVAVDVTGHKKAVAFHGPLIMINPVITECGGVSVNREGCLSVPDFTGNVLRSERVVVTYIDVQGRHQKLETSGFEAVVIQHELDHLDGVLFLDRIKDMKRDLFKRVFNKVKG